MSANESQAEILLFEDDEAFANIIKLLGPRLGHEVKHYPGFPVANGELFHQEHAQPPLLVILDYGLPGMNGLQICRELRKIYPDAHFPIVFLSGNTEEDSILECYEAGADDFITKPVQIPQLQARLDKIIHEYKDRLNIEKQLADSRDIAYKAMSTTSELGLVIRFLEYLFDCNNYRSIADSLFESLLASQLRTCLKIYVKPDNECFSDDGIVREIEARLIDELRDKGRIFDFGKRTVFNFSKLSLLVKNMPVDDPELYGKLKDNLSILLNGADARVSALETSYLSMMQNCRIGATATVIKMMIGEIEQDNIELSKKFEAIIQELEFGMTNALMHFNLLEEEEAKIMELVTQAINRASGIFDHSIEQGKHYREVMNGLTQTLESGANDKK